MWEELKDDEGRLYYYNSETQETTWELPEGATLLAVAADTEEPQRIGEWQVFHDDEGREYYYNERREETTWDRPSEPTADTKEQSARSELNTELARDLELKQKPVDGLVVSLGPTASRSRDRDVGGGSKSRSETNDEDKDGKSLSETLSSLPPPEAFKQELARINIDRTVSFKKVIQLLIDSPHYWAIDSALERKRLYDEYLRDLAERQITTKAEAIERFKSDFRLALSGYWEDDTFTGQTRWMLAKQRLESDDVAVYTQSVVPELTIVATFYELRDEMATKNSEALAQKKTKALGELAVYLKETNPGLVKGLAGWQQLWKSLKADPRFQANRHFELLSDLDILELYRKELLPTLVTDLEAQVALEQAKNWRKDRQARDGFKNELSKLNIGPLTTLATLLPTLESLSAYVELAGRDGSCAAELIWDVIDESIQTVRVAADVVQQVLTEHGQGELKAVNSLEMLKEVVNGYSDPRTAKIDWESIGGDLWEMLDQRSAAKYQRELDQAINKVDGAVSELPKSVLEVVENFHGDSEEKKAEALEKLKQAGARRSRKRGHGEEDDREKKRVVLNY